MQIMQYLLNLQIQTFGFCAVRQACSSKICSEVTIKQWWPSLRTSNNVQHSVWLIFVSSEQNMIKHPNSQNKNMTSRTIEISGAAHAMCHVSHMLLFSLETQQLPGPGKSNSPRGCSIRLRPSRQSQMVPWIPGEPQQVRQHCNMTYQNLSLLPCVTSLSSTSTLDTNKHNNMLSTCQPPKQ